MEKGMSFQLKYISDNSASFSLILFLLPWLWLSDATLKLPESSPNCHSKQESPTTEREVTDTIWMRLDPYPTGAPPLRATCMLSIPDHGAYCTIKGNQRNLKDKPTKDTGAERNDWYKRKSISSHPFAHTRHNTSCRGQSWPRLRLGMRVVQ